MPVTASTAEYTNKFLGSTTDDFISTGEQYALSNAGTFRKVATGVTIPAKHAYIVPESSSPAKDMALDFGGVSGIMDINAESESNQDR